MLKQFKMVLNKVFLFTKSWVIYYTGLQPYNIALDNMIYQSHKQFLPGSYVRICQAQQKKISGSLTLTKQYLREILNKTNDYTIFLTHHAKKRYWWNYSHLTYGCGISNTSVFVAGQDFRSKSNYGRCWNHMHPPKVICVCKCFNKFIVTMKLGSL